MPEITTLPPTATTLPRNATPFDLLLPRSEPVADDRFARRLASASEGGEQRQAPETAAKVKHNSAKKSDPVVAEEAPVEGAEESEPLTETTVEPTNELAQEVAAAAALIVATPVETEVSLLVEPELAVIEEVAVTPPEAPPVPVEATSDVAFADVLAETEPLVTEEVETKLDAEVIGEANPTTSAEVIVAPITSTTPNFTATDERETPAPAEEETNAQVATQSNEGPSPPASQLSANSPTTAESDPSTNSTEGETDETDESDEVEDIETNAEQLTATDLTAADQFDRGREQTDKPAAEPRVETRAETPTPTREPEPQRTIDRLPGGAAAGGRQSPTNDGPVINAQRFVSRVSRAFESARDNGGSIHLRLSPPELGELALRLSLNDGVLTAQIETDTQSARNALLDNLPALRERLAQQEIRIDKFEVDVRQQGSGSNSRESYTGGESPGEQPSPDSRRPRRDVPTETTRPARRTATQVAGNGRINYVA